MKVKLIEETELRDLEANISGFLRTPVGDWRRTIGGGLFGGIGQTVEGGLLYPEPISITISYANQLFIAAIVYREMQEGKSR